MFKDIITQDSDIADHELKSVRMLARRSRKSRLIKVLYIGSILFIGMLFLPWTQNIRSMGKVTALQPQQRPQTIQNIIAGKIEKWYVREGQFVKKGDTILRISEIKPEYFNPDLVANTGKQLESKDASVRSYAQKLGSIDAQINAMISSRDLKYKQAENKLYQSRLKYRNDSLDLSAIALNEKIANEQLQRMEQMYKDGLKPLTDLEARRIKAQEFQLKTISQQNKLISSRNEVINSQIELNNIMADFSEKISKLEADKNSTMSSMFDAEASVTKLQNDYVNYSMRSDLYVITAPQDGYVSKALQSGVGETIKEGTAIVSIVPADYELAVEIFVNPMDIPLLQVNQHVNIQFDGWPSIVFSGWPGVSYGTYGGKVVAIDNFISDNGKYRVLVQHEEKSPTWPKEIRMGSGASAFIMLKDVPIWYEAWRNINGFPPDYYKENKNKETTKYKR